MLNIILYLLLLVCLIAGVVIVVVNLPGLWLMVLAAALYAVLTKPAFGFITFKVLLWLAGLALVAEGVDFFAAGAGAKRAGASGRGLWGAIIGGIVGAIVGSFVLPLIFTLVGVCAGTFVGAFIGEISGGKQIGQSARIGAHATAGRLAGTLMKLAFGGVMALIIMWSGWPVRKAPIAVSPPPARVIVHAPATTMAS